MQPLHFPKFWILFMTTATTLEHKFSILWNIQNLSVFKGESFQSLKLKFSEFHQYRNLEKQLRFSLIQSYSSFKYLIKVSLVLSARFWIYWLWPALPIGEGVEYDTKLHLMVILHLWRVWSTLSLPLLLSPTRVYNIE